MFGQLTNHSSQDNASNRCKNHPQFDIDTICFNLACRKNGKQIICSCCGEQQPHMNHSHQLYPIYRTSPGLRIITEEKQSEDLAILGQFKQVAAEKIIQLQNFFLESVEKIAKKAQKKIQCITDFFEKNASLKICCKIRQNFGNHLECCVQMINNLKDFQERSSSSQGLAHKLIQDRIKHESLFLINQIEFLQNGLVNLFNNLNNKNFSQTTNEQSACKQPTNNQNIGIQLKVNGKFGRQQKIIDLQKEQSDKLSQLVSKINPLRSPGLKNKSKCPQYNLLLNTSSKQADKQFQFGQQKSLMNSFMLLDKQLNENPNKGRKNPRILQNIESKNKKPIGFEFQKQNTILIWNASSQVIEYLANLVEVQHLIIQDRQFSQSALLYLTKKMKKLKGIHFNCENQIPFNILQQIDIQYLSLFPSYRFMQIMDQSQYFPKIQRTALDCISQQSLIKLYNGRYRGIKNRYICQENLFYINNFVSQVNFIQTQWGFSWVFRNGLQQRLFSLNHLQILAFNNILIEKNVKLKQVYKKIHSLHTLVFDNCQANYDQLVQQFQYLKPYQLKHLQLSGDCLDRKVELTVPAIEEIFRQIYLQTLIITNIKFKQEGGGNIKLRKALVGIRKLSKLTYLNLFNSWPFKGRILSFLHKNCSQQLISLNVGCSWLKQESFQEIQRFSRLESLSLDYTGINQSQMLSIMQALPCLKNLSIQNLNGSCIASQKKGSKTKRRNYGSIMPSFFKKLKRKNLKFINLYNCYSFFNYQWQGFNQLECIRINEDLLTQSTMQRLKQKVQKDQFLQQILSSNNNHNKINHISLSDDEKPNNHQNSIDAKNNQEELNENQLLELIKDQIDESFLIQEEQNKDHMSNDHFSQEGSICVREVKRKKYKKQLSQIASE